jgi:hypothetical protein
MNTVYCRCCGSEVINCVCRIPDDDDELFVMGYDDLALIPGNGKSLMQLNMFI